VRLYAAPAETTSCSTAQDNTRADAKAREFLVVQTRALASRTSSSERDLKDVPHALLASSTNGPDPVVVDV
jgi:hypothetical protein